jgi:hypothetical protein
VQLVQDEQAKARDRIAASRQRKKVVDAPALSFGSKNIFSFYLLYLLYLLFALIFKNLPRAGFAALRRKPACSRIEMPAVTRASARRQAWSQLTRKKSPCTML